MLHNELYFAKNSSNWGNGGVAFVKNCIDPAKNTLGRMYLITEEQFCDVVKQETKSDKFVSIGFEKAIRDGRLNIKPASWYGQLIYLGHKKGFPIFTFTNENDLTSFTRPSPSYLRTIIQGIYETYSLEHKQIMNYLFDKAGITGNYTKQDLANLINGALIALDFPIQDDQGKDKL